MSISRFFLLAVMAVFMLLLPSTKSTVADNNATYGQLAQQYIGYWYSLFLQELPELNATSDPGLVNPLRKACLFVRDMLDVFAYAYPTPVKAGDLDLWVKTREMFNDGYTWIGNFQNLNHSSINYTEKELDHLRNICLWWKGNYTQFNATYNVDHYLFNPDIYNYYFRDAATVYSEFFWQNVVFPAQPTITSMKQNYTGLSILTFLEANLIQLAIDRYQSVYNLDEVYTIDKHAEFHDYRKLIRAITGVPTLFPYSTPLFVNASLVNMNTSVGLYNSFGNLNDNATAYQFYAAHNSTYMLTEAARLWTIIGWGELRLTLLALDFPSILNQMLQQLTFPIPHAYTPSPTHPPTEESHLVIILAIGIGVALPLMLIGAGLVIWWLRRRNSDYEKIESARL